MPKWSGIYDQRLSEMNLAGVLSRSPVSFSAFQGWAEEVADGEFFILQQRTHPGDACYPPGGWNRIQGFCKEVLARPEMFIARSVRLPKVVPKPLEKNGHDPHPYGHGSQPPGSSLLHSTVRCLTRCNSPSSRQGRMSILSIPWRQAGSKAGSRFWTSQVQRKPTHTS